MYIVDLYISSILEHKIHRYAKLSHVDLSLKRNTCTHNNFNYDINCV